MSPTPLPEPPIHRGPSRWLTLFPCILLLATIASIAVCSHHGPRAWASRAKCAANLSAIGQAILLYADGNRGQLPDTLATLMQTEDITGNVFVCPESDDTPADSHTNLATAAGHLSYIYIGNGMNSANLTRDIVVAYEPLSNHADAGMHVLFGDGHVDFISPAAAGLLISKVAAKAFPVMMPSQ